jgi:hypothetical protein
VNVQCEKCNISETSSSADKGSGWDGLGQFSMFKVEVESSGSGREEPNVSSAQCNSCGAEAKVLKAYGFNCPENFK